jgi:hypothetical protein
MTGEYYIISIKSMNSAIEIVTTLVHNYGFYTNFIIPVQNDSFNNPFYNTRPELLFPKVIHFLIPTLSYSFSG